VEKIPWYASHTLRALLVAFVSQVIIWLGITDVLPTENAALLVDGVLQVVAIVATGWAGYARAAKPTPPITNVALERTHDRIRSDYDQGGFVRPLMLALMIAIAAPAVVAVSGCQAIGLQQPQSFGERYAYALGQTTALRQAATDGLKAGALKAEDAEYVLTVTDRSRALLDAARGAFVAGDVQTAEGRLSLTVQVLTQLQAYLRSKGGVA
jgi:hypothetical protein